MNEVEKRIDDALNSLGEDAEGKLKVRLEAWKLRVAGYSHEGIAECLNISIPTAYRYVQWCLKNLPAAYESAEDFRRVSLRRLDHMIERLEDNRSGEGSDAAIKTTAHLMDMQAKLLGAYAPTKVDGSLTVKTVLEGVDTEKL